MSSKIRQVCAVSIYGIVAFANPYSKQ